MPTQLRSGASAVTPTLPAVGTPWRRAITAWPALAGIGYAAAWLAGLSIFSSSTTVNSAGTQVVAGYAGHQAVATAQFALTEGLAAVCLAAAAAAICRRAGVTAGARQAGVTAGVRQARVSTRAARVVAVAGGAAALMSLAQCAIGVYLINRAVPAGHAATAGALNEAITRMDGVKMLVLAGMGLAGAGLARRGLLPRWLGYAGAALAVAITVSGLGYLLLLSGLAAAAWVSLPLLLVWVAGAGIALGRSGRPARADR
jgi:hypothetical protein